MNLLRQLEGEGEGKPSSIPIADDSLRILRIRMRWRGIGAGVFTITGASWLTDDDFWIVRGKLQEALAYIHAKEYAHCDVSPSNLIVHKSPASTDLKVLLADWCSAAPLSESFSFFRGSLLYTRMRRPSLGNQLQCMKMRRLHTPLQLLFVKRYQFLVRFSLAGLHEVNVEKVVKKLQQKSLFCWHVPRRVYSRKRVNNNCGSGVVRRVYSFSCWCVKAVTLFCCLSGVEINAIYLVEICNCMLLM